MRYFILLISSIVIIEFSAFTTTDKLPDLVIIKMDFPKWDTVAKNMYSYINVSIKNSGEAPSSLTKIKLSDLDISYADAKKMKLSKWELSVVKDEERLRNEEKQDDVFFEMSEDLPVLQPGEERTVIFVVKQWLFDPDIDLEALVDPLNVVKEKNEKNNKKYFFLNG